MPVKCECKIGVIEKFMDVILLLFIGLRDEKYILLNK